MKDTINNFDNKLFELENKKNKLFKSKSEKDKIIIKKITFQLRFSHIKFRAKVNSLTYYKIDASIFEILFNK